MSGSDHPMHTHRVDSAAVEALGRMTDAAEGVNARREKRMPEWGLSASSDLPDLPWPADLQFDDPA